VKSALKTLDIELNLKGREFKRLSGEDDLESIEGLFKVLYWRITGTIKPDEFIVLYFEWTKHKKITDIRNTVSTFSPVFRSPE